MKNRGLQLGALGGDLETKNLSKAVLADFGQFGPRSDRPKSCPHGLGAKMAPRCSKLRPSWPSWGHLGGILSIFGGLWWSWERYLRKWRKSKIERQYNVLAIFWGLGDASWRLLGSILGGLGHKLDSLGLSLWILA